jgi:hypothetical protein
VPIEVGFVVQRGGANHVASTLLDGYDHHKRFEFLQPCFAIGQWNQLEIICQKDEIKVFVNRNLVNHAAECSVTRGAITLQSEGRPIEFRDIRLTPLK